LYDATVVPVGEDQRQHLELTRDLANRFNNMYGETFVVPEAYTPKVGARIKSLTEPTKKMDKSSENPKSYILLQDDLNAAKNKIRSAVTDSDSKIKFDEKNKPGISNLLMIYAALTDRSIKDIEDQYIGSTYQAFKEDLANIVYDTLKPIQEKFNEILKSKELDEILDKGREKASYIARRKMSKVYKRIGLGR
jgi:tryptophanyl-tRNA synthetase